MFQLINIIGFHIFWWQNVVVFNDLPFHVVLQRRATVHIS